MYLLLFVNANVLLSSAMEIEPGDESTCGSYDSEFTGSVGIYHSEHDALSATEYYLGSRRTANLTLTRTLQSDLCFMQTLGGMPNCSHLRLECIACILKNDCLKKQTFKHSFHHLPDHHHLSDPTIVEGPTQSAPINETRAMSFDPHAHPGT